MKIFVVTPVEGYEWYMIGDSSLTPWRKPLFLPEFESDMRLRPAAVIAIGRVGKSIPLRFARRYYSTASAGFTVRAEKLFRSLAAAGKPVTPAVSVDYSAFFSPSVSANEAAVAFASGVDVSIDGAKQGEVRFHDLFDLADETIARLSKTNTLKNGDMIFLDPGGKGLAIAEGSRVAFSCNGDVFHSFTVK